MTDRPSAGAQVIVQLVVVLEERTCQQLRALLADDVATRDTLKPAVYSLAGIATLIDTLGCVPTIEEYEDARTAHPAWPHLSSLGRRYGSWLPAVSAAVNVTCDPPSWGLPARTQSQPTYSRTDCVRARSTGASWRSAIGLTNASTRSGNASKRISAAGRGTLDRAPPSKTAVLRRPRTWPDASTLRAASPLNPATTTDPPPASGSDTSVPAQRR